MSDIALVYTNGCFDLDVLNGDLVADPSLETAVSISLFTDRRVTDEDLPIGQTHKRGWWGDMYADIQEDKIGSRLWTIFPGKKTIENLKRSEDFAKESLQWMIEDGIASDIICSSEYNNNRDLLINLQIVKPDGLQSRFSVNWDAQEIKRGF